MDVNKQQQSAGDNSNQIIAHTVNQYSGIQISDVVPIVRGLVKSELEVYQKLADINAKIRFEEFSKSLELEIESKVADKVEKFSEPSMQYAAREATLGYIKSGDGEQKDMLIDLMIERINSEDQSSIQLLIDEAIKILPKLSSKCIAVLTLMAYCNLKATGKKSVLISSIQKINPVIDKVYDIKNLDLEYLVQTGCISSILGFIRNKDWIQSNIEYYPLLFCHLDNQEAVDQFFSKYGIEKKDKALYFPKSIGSQEFTNFVSYFDLTVEGGIIPGLLAPENYFEIADNLKPFEKDDILSLLEKRTPMNDQEVINFYSGINPRWVETIKAIDGKISQYTLNLVGKYIGVLHLSKLLDTPLSLDLLVPN